MRTKRRKNIEITPTMLTYDSRPSFVVQVVGSTMATKMAATYIRGKAGKRLFTLSMKRIDMMPHAPISSRVNATETKTRPLRP